MVCILIVGLGWGDESKGAACDFLCHDPSLGVRLIVRHNGGCQAAHNVVTPDGRHHTFSQFGSGMFNPEVETHLSRFMLVDPITMLVEEQYLQRQGITNAWDRTTIDPRAVVVTPYHRCLNRFRENARRPGEKHGSCGMGVGEAVAHYWNEPDTILKVKDILMSTPAELRSKLLEVIRYVKAVALKEVGGIIEGDLGKAGSVDFVVDNYTAWAGRMKVAVDYSVMQHSTGTVVFEGAQGVMLDQTYGTAPHNTWSDCTFNNAKTLIEESGVDADIYRIGCIRSYYTRHGAGPFPTEDASISFPELHNSSTNFQGKFRQGHFDPVLCRYAIQALGGIEGIFLSHLDMTDPLQYAATARISSIENLVGSPVLFASTGPTRNDRARIKRWPKPIKTIPSSTPLDIMPDLKDLLTVPA